MNTVQYNNSLSSKNKKLIVDFAKFKSMNEESENGIDKMVASIKRVCQGIDCMYVEFDDNKIMELDFKGGYKKYRSNETLASQRSLGTKMRTENGHIQLKIDKNTILFERMIAICYDITQNKMPDSYKDWVANVMDGSGSVLTAAKLGIPVNYHPDNIEWCSRKENGVHGYMIMEMYKRTGCVYRYSANDRILRYIFSKCSNMNLIYYCQNYLKRIK